MSPTPSYRLVVDNLLRERGYEALDRFLLDRRRQGLSYENIARELSARVDSPITSGTVRRWFHKIGDAKESAA